MGVVARRYHVNRDMARTGVVLQAIENRQSGMIRQAHVEDDRRWRILARGHQRVLGSRRQQAEKVELVRQLIEDTREHLVILDDKNAAARAGQPVAIVGNAAHRFRCGFTRFLLLAIPARRPFDLRWGGLGRSRRAQQSLCPCRVIGEGQGDSEGRSLIRNAVDGQNAAQQTRQLATNRQTKAGAAIFAADRAVRLAEGVEHRLLLFRRNAYAGVGHGEADIALAGPADRQID